MRRRIAGHGSTMALASVCPTLPACIESRLPGSFPNFRYSYRPHDWGAQEFGCLWRWGLDCVLALWQVRCLDYALQMGADITLNSYGGLYADSYALQSAIEAADQKGQLFVTAAGNDYGASLIISMSIHLGKDTCVIRQIAGGSQASRSRCCTHKVVQEQQDVKQCKAKLCRATCNSQTWAAHNIVHAYRGGH